MILYACETCMTFSPEEPLPKHAYHNVIGLHGHDYDAVSRSAAAHLVLARRIRTGDVENALTAELAEARLHADWFSEEDSEYDK